MDLRFCPTFSEQPNYLFRRQCPERFLYFATLQGLHHEAWGYRSKNGLFLKNLLWVCPVSIHWLVTRHWLGQSKSRHPVLPDDYGVEIQWIQCHPTGMDMELTFSTELAWMIIQAASLFFLVHSFSPFHSRVPNPSNQLCHSCHFVASVVPWGRTLYLLDSQWHHCRTTRNEWRRRPVCLQTTLKNDSTDGGLLGKWWKISQ